MSDGIKELELRLIALEAQVSAYEQLIQQVGRTCGQSNCNCVGSNQIKRMVKDLGFAPSVERQSR